MDESLQNLGPESKGIGSTRRPAIELNTDLIVIASHGLGGLKHAFIGSTSEGVVRHAPCPVLTIREHTFATDEAQQPSLRRGESW